MTSRRQPRAATHPRPRAGDDAARIARVAIVAMCGALAFGWKGPVDAWEQAEGTCRISGHALSGAAPLPGVSVLVKSAGAVKTATSTDPDGTYRVALAFGTYDLAAELTGFTTVSRSITVAGTACDQTVDFQLSLAPRVPIAAAQPGAAPTPPASGAGRGAPPASGATATPAANGARGQRFETLTVQTQAAAAAGVETTETSDAGRAPAAAAGLLDRRPDGGGRDQRQHGQPRSRHDERSARRHRPRRVRSGDRRIRLRASGRAAVAARWPGGSAARAGAAGSADRAADAADPVGRAAVAADFVLGGRGRGQNAYNVAVELLVRRIGARQRAVPAASRIVGAAAPVLAAELRRDASAVRCEIPGIYKGDRRTNFMATYSGTRGGDLFDQYATVPTAAMRAGDFSSIPSQLIDPATGLPFAGNLIPADRSSAGVARAAAVHPAAEPRRHEPQLSLRRRRTRRR